MMQSIQQKHLPNVDSRVQELYKNNLAIGSAWPAYKYRIEMGRLHIPFFLTSCAVSDIVLWSSYFCTVPKQPIPIFISVTCGCITSGHTTSCMRPHATPAADTGCQ